MYIQFRLSIYLILKDAEVNVPTDMCIYDFYIQMRNLQPRW